MDRNKIEQLEDRLEELESRLDEINQVLELDNHEENNDYNADEVCEQCYEEECSCDEDDENDFDNDDQMMMDTKMKTNGIHQMTKMKTK